jgi:hypothetical protein
VRAAVRGDFPTANFSARNMHETSETEEAEPQDSLVFSQRIEQTSRDNNALLADLPTARKVPLSKRLVGLLGSELEVGRELLVRGRGGL